MKKLFLRVLPFIISMLAGVVITLFVERYVKGENLNSLLLGIASGLFSIPFVFICYEFINKITTKSINDSLLEHLVFELNDIIISIIQNLKNMVGFEEPITKDNLGYFLHNVKKLIKNNHRKDISPECINSLINNKKRIMDLIYTGNNFYVLSQDQIKNVLGIGKTLGIIATELENLEKVAKNNTFRASVVELSEKIEDWIDFCEEDAVVNHHSFAMIN